MDVCGGGHAWGRLVTDTCEGGEPHPLWTNARIHQGFTLSPSLPLSSGSPGFRAESFSWTWEAGLQRWTPPHLVERGRIQ